MLDNSRDLSKKLSKIGFGMDIDYLESYLIDYKQAYALTDLRDYEYNQVELEGCLRQLKPESIAFSVETNLKESELDDTDKLFIDHLNKHNRIVYDITNSEIESLQKLIDSCTDGLSNFVGMLNIQGLDVSAVYKDGFLMYINVIGENNKYNDITDLLYGEVPITVDELSECGLIELRGKLTISHNNPQVQSISKHIETSVMRCVRCEIYGDKLEILFNNIFMSESTEELFNNEWEKLEFLRSIGFKVPLTGLLRGIDSESLPNALSEIESYLKSKNQSYPCKGYEIRVEDGNSLIDTFTYNTQSVPSTQLFSSIVKSFSIETNELRIAETQCNSSLAVSKLQVDDIYTLEELNIHIGSKVVFNVIEGIGVLNKKYTQMITQRI